MQEPDGSLGTVTYTYNTNMTLHTKTDAKTQVFTYTYDSYNRLTQISVGSTVLRTYVYDSNTDNPSYSQNGAGRFGRGQIWSDYLSQRLLHRVEPHHHVHRHVQLHPGRTGGWQGPAHGA